MVHRIHLHDESIQFVLEKFLDFLQDHQKDPQALISQDRIPDTKDE